MPIRFPMSICLAAVLMVLAPAVHAQEDQRPYELPRVGDGLEPGETEYFLLFPDWTGYGEASVRRAAVRVWRTATDSILLQRGGVDAPGIVLSDSAALALAFYLQHFEKLRHEDSPAFLPTSDRVPDSLHRGMRELLDRAVLPPWWPGWSRKEGESLVTVAMKDGQTFRGRILAVTDRRLLLWSDSLEYSAERIVDHLHSLRWDDVGTVRVPDERSTELGWAGMYMGLMAANLMIGIEDRHVRDIDGLDQLGNDIGRAIFIGLGSLLFLSAESIVTEYSAGAPADSRDLVRIATSPLREARLLRPGTPPEIRAMIDSASGERLLAETAPLPLQRRIREDERTMRSGVWVGTEQFWLGRTEATGFLTGAAVGYVFPLMEITPGLLRLGLDVVASGAQTFGSAGVRGFLQLRWFRLGAGIRGMVLDETLHTTSNGWSKWGDSYSSKTVLHQHASKPGHYLFADFGFDIALRRLSIGVRRIEQFTPSGYAVRSWSSYDNMQQSSGQSIDTGIRLTAWAVSLQVWL